MDSTVYIRLGVVSVLAAFPPFVAVSYFRQRRDRRLARLGEILHRLGADGEGATLGHDSFDRRAFVLPVIFVTVLSALGFVHLFFGNEILGDGVERNLLLAGTAPLDGLEASAAAERLGLLVVVIAFASAFLWSCHNLFRRLIAGDLRPGTFYGAGLRMCFAPLLALVIAWLPAVGDYGRDTLPAIAFLIGLFPKRALHWLKEKVGLFTRGADEAAELPLGAIEGMTAFDRMRFAELGIDNAQGLAESTLVDLLIATPYPWPRLIDWMAQARLLLVAKDDTPALRQAGIRDAFALVAADLESGALSGGPAPEHLTPELLAQLQESVAGDPGFGVLRGQRELLTAEFAGDSRGGKARVDAGGRSSG